MTTKNDEAGDSDAKYIGQRLGRDVVKPYSQDQGSDFHHTNSIG